MRIEKSSLSDVRARRDLRMRWARTEPQHRAYHVRLAREYNHRLVTMLISIGEIQRIGAAQGRDGL